MSVNKVFAPFSIYTTPSKTPCGAIGKAIFRFWQLNLLKNRGLFRFLRRSLSAKRFVRGMSVGSTVARISLRAYLFAAGLRRQVLRAFARTNARAIAYGSYSGSPPGLYSDRSKGTYCPGIKGCSSKFFTSDSCSAHKSRFFIIFPPMCCRAACRAVLLWGVRRFDSGNLRDCRQYICLLYCGWALRCPLRLLAVGNRKIWRRN